MMKYKHSVEPNPESQKQCRKYRTNNEGRSCALQAGKAAQLVKSLLCSHEDASSISIKQNNK